MMHDRLRVTFFSQAPRVGDEVLLVVNCPLDCRYAIGRFDAVTSGQIEMDQPRLRMGCGLRPGKSRPITFEPIFLVHLNRPCFGKRGLVGPLSQDARGKVQVMPTT